MSCRGAPPPTRYLVTTPPASSIALRYLVITPHRRAAVHPAYARWLHDAGLSPWSAPPVVEEVPNPNPNPNPYPYPYP